MGRLSVMPAAPFFRDVVLPSHAQDRRAHERFLLTAQSERRDEPAAPTFMARVLATLGVAPASRP